MKKLLITLRDPGPAQAIFSAISYIENEYDVYIIATSAALNLIFSRYENKITNRIKVFTVYKNRCEIVKNITDFGNKYIYVFKEKGKQYYLFVKCLIDFLNILKPEIILRTTPSKDYGIDEAIVDAYNGSLITSKMKCYQDYYDCGMDLENFPGEIATVDAIAKKRLNEYGIISETVGWLSQFDFFKFDNFIISRKKARKKLNLKEEKAILYCTSASGNINAELLHFKMLLKYKRHTDALFIRFHPRNSYKEKKQYYKILHYHNVICVDNLKYEELLSFPDILISAASQINIDLIQYQIASQIKIPKCISIYTKGKITDEIIIAAIGKNNNSINFNELGILLQNENHMLPSDFEIENYAKLYEKSKKVFNSSKDHLLNKLISFIKK